MRDDFSKEPRWLLLHFFKHRHWSSCIQQTRRRDTSHILLLLLMEKMLIMMHLHLGLLLLEQMMMTMSCLWVINC